MITLPKLYQIAQEQNIEVDCFELNKREAFSLMDSSGDCYIAIDPYKLRSQQDERMKLAHELGHCMTGSFYNQYAAVDCRQRHENRADRWAIRHMISESDLQTAVDHGVTEVWDLAEYFDLPEPFIRKAIHFYTYGNLDVEYHAEKISI